MSLAINLQALMDAKGLNPTSLERALRRKVRQATIKRILDGEIKDSRISTAQALAAYFNISMDELCGDGHAPSAAGLREPRARAYDPLALSEDETVLIKGFRRAHVQVRNAMLSMAMAALPLSGAQVAQ